ncbi:S41 family peptidase [Mangrovivirga cuniculi]|uniref:Tail specific protease domain-containing protein n=1 Tax=Mangrovivirga cuniculi TaxID=2715131 RepID=A0A4D7JU88_9BACT|nr:S41 family peptidase [Mangrovivirga cuniculi]QCK16172.1 hypothetical protein DCC35_16190 [Mangrovivirga cuniculi]
MNRLKEIITLIFICLPIFSYGQSKEEIIKKAQELMLENYIFLDKAGKTNTHLDKLLKSNYFDEFKEPKKFARALSKEMQKITKDKHLNITPPPPPPHPNSETDFITRHLEIYERFREGGFGKINLLKGNVGYVELKGFRKEDIPKVDAIMDYLSTADAIIIDLRGNGGGNSLGLYWSSYFLGENIPLSGVYERRTDTYKELKTVSVKGRNRMEVPLFVLTSDFTFSAAEAFAYDLQSRKRAIIIGESTGGGAHPVNHMPLTGGYGIIMPYARSINPITKTNWEGVGVQPDIPVTKEEAFSKAHELAIKAATDYREEPFNKLKTILLKKKLTTDDESQVYDLISLLLSRKHIEKFMVNDMGYFYLDNHQIHSALAIFKANLKIFPGSPNAHDSYAEGLALNGEKNQALKHYKKAVKLAEEQNDPRLLSYKKNLSDFKATITSVTGQ